MLVCFSFIQFSSNNTAHAATGINHQIGFQGKLVNPDGTNVTNGTYSIVFSIYTVASAGSNVWTETQTPTVTNGIFQVSLGSVTTLPASVDFNTDNIYLGVKVGADAEMTPRIQFASVPQAFNSEKLGGLDKTGFIQNTVTQQATSNFNISGAGVIGTTLTTPTLQSAAATALTITGNAASTWSTSAGNITLQAGSGTVSLGSTTTLSSTGALTVTGGSTLSLTSTGSATVSLDNGTTGSINIGTGTGATKTIQIGNTGTSGIAETINIGNATGTSTAAITIGSSVSSSTTIIQAGDGATGGISLNVTGTNNRGTVVKSTTTNSTAAFQVQNAAGTALLIADTTNTKIGFGIAPAATSTLLDINGASTWRGIAAPSVSQAGQGVIYYDSTINKFKTSENGGAYSVIGTPANTYLQGGNSFGATATLGTLDANSLSVVTFNGTAAQQRISITNTANSTLNSTLNFTGASVFQPTADSTTAFQVQNAAGTNIFNVDTTNAKIGTANTTIASTNSQALTIKSGDASGTTSNSGNVVIDSGSATGTAGNISLGTGAYAHNTTIGNTTGNSAVTIQGGTGTIAIGTGGIGNTIQIGTTTGAVTQQINIGTNATASSSTPVTIGSTIGASALLLNSGTGNITLQPAGTGTTGAVQIGAGGSGSTTPDLFKLDVKSDTGDPTGTNGSIYYNQASSTFRCYENSVWRDCLTQPSSATATADTTTTSTTDVALNSMSLTPGAGGYIVSFTGSEQSAGQTDTITVSIYKNGTQIAASEVSQRAPNQTNNSFNVSTSAYITGLAAGQTIDVRWRTSAGTATMHQRTLIVDRVGADLAENYYTTDASVNPGDIVTVDGSLPAGARKSGSAYDSRVLGIVSTKPNRILDDGIGQAYGHSIPVALSGRVPVKISDTSQAIAAGDYITTSGDEGKGIKATQPGMVIGKALESWTPGTGQASVMVFVENGWQNVGQADQNAALLAQLSRDGLPNLSVSGPMDAQTLVVRGSATIQTLTVTGIATFQGDLLLGGHFVTQGISGQIAAAIAAGSHATVQMDGNDTAGTITVTTGDDPTIGILSTLKFNKAYAATPRVVLTAFGSASASSQYYYDATRDSFNLGVNGRLLPHTSYTYSYFVTQ